MGRGLAARTGTSRSRSTPALAYDRDRTLEQALRFHEEIDRPNLFVKIPATEPGLGAIEDAIAKGKSINVTLIFSLDRYRAVVEAYIRGLERLVEAGGDPSPVASVASFFVSRVDTEADKRLEELGNSALQGKLAIANAKLAYQHYLEAFSGERWERLAAAGAAKQRCLWASTSTKNPAYRDVMYVEELIGPETVNTMPLETIEAFQDHGEVRGDTLLEGVDEAKRLFEELRAAGVDYDDVTDTLETRGSAEVRGLVRGAARRDPREAGRARRGLSSVVQRIWARDTSLWTGGDEDRWLGWLDVVSRVRPRLDELTAFAETAAGHFDSFVLLGMGGSSLAPEVLRRAFRADGFHVLDTTHPAAIRRLERELDLERTLFLVSSKSGSTLETRSHADYFWERSGGQGAHFAAITDPGSELERLATERGFRATFPGEPEIGGRYSALSLFGIVPAALMGVDLERFLDRAGEAMEALRAEDGNPGLELGLALGEGWRAGRDKVCIDDDPSGFGLWAEQLIAESTGKEGKGLVPAPGESPDGPDRQRGEVRLPDPYELAQEFLRWEFATAVAGHVLGINPFDQPDVQAAKDKTNEVLARRRAGPLAARLARRAARRARARATTSRSRRSSIRRASGELDAAPRAGARDRLRGHAAGSARATCTRPVSCTRAVLTRASSCRSSTTSARRSGFPDRDFGFGRLIERAGGRRSRGARGARLRALRRSRASH